MSDAFDVALKFVLAREGGFAELKGDEITNLGVKKSTWEAHVGRLVTKDDMRALTVEAVKPLYRKKYYEKAYCDKMYVPLNICVFDFAVHSGPDQALRTLARQVNTELNYSKIPELLAKINSTIDKKKLISDYNLARSKFLEKLKNYKDFGKGWKNRIRHLNREVATIPISNQ